MKIQSFKFTSTTEDESGEVLEACEIKTYAVEISDVVQSFRLFLLASGFPPDTIDQYIEPF